MTSQPSTNDETNKTNQNKIKNNYVNTHNNDLQTCIICDGTCKDVISCQRFQTANRSDRWNFVKLKKLCKRCLSPLVDANCTCRNSCGIDSCSFKHHRLLHRFNEIDNDTTTLAAISDSNSVVGLHSPRTAAIYDTNVLFKILPITVYGKNTSKKILAFIDEGSSISLIDENLAKELNLNGNKQRLCLNWTGNVQRVEECSQALKLVLSGPDKKTFNIQAHTVRQLGLPAQSMQYKKLFKTFPHLSGLPIEDFESTSPLLLIGANNWSLGIPMEIREGQPNEPVAVRTRLGWLIYGNMNGNKNVGHSYNFYICDCNNEQLNTIHNLMKEFFALDSIGINVKLRPAISSEDERAIELLNKFTKQQAGGHYETGLLWRNENPKLPDSFLMAKRRLICLEKRLLQDPNLRAIFNKTIKDYETKGYITKLTGQQIKKPICDGKVWYLPIFAVCNKNKPGKVRIVWDAAAKTNGISLNSMLLTGPDLLTSLPAILMRFRQKQVAICGDIKEMFHQVIIRHDDRDAQRFLWRSCDANKEPDVYVMNVMIFGAACAPSISQYVKNLNASKFEDKLPAACKAIIQNHYVDDYLDSVDSIDEAIDLASEVKLIHAQGGFHIRNWLSNKRAVLETVSEKAEDSEKSLPLQEIMSVEKVLGMFWVPTEDVFTFKLSNTLCNSEILSLKTVPTKRQVLQLVMSLYDPLGLIANILMYAKILLQDIWRSQVDWEEPIKQREFVNWQNWLRIIPKLKHLKIDRCYLKEFPNYEGLVVQLHTFVDASENGYAAVSYCRISQEKKFVCSLVMSKARVSPLKMISIPRLELMAALIGARLAKFVDTSQTIKIHQRYFWSDSKTVLSWLKSDHRNYHQFVAFRVSEILDLTNLNEWKWVPGKLNVADEATKWPKKRLEYNVQDRWFKAPDFLYRSEDEWPVQSENFMPTTAELRKRVCIVYKYDPIIDVTRFSNWKRLVRATAYFLRSVAKWRNRSSYNEELTSNELREAEIAIFRQAQGEYFLHEINLIETGQQVTKHSSIYKLSPNLDKDRVLRVSGRIDNAYIENEYKQPIILPKSSKVTELIILYYHDLYYHMNHETTLNEIRLKFQIPRLRATFKRVIKSCQKCKIFKAKPVTPQMAKLPRARLASGLSPFTFTGLDFFGPIYILVNRHKEKRYGALFNCLTVRAVHIEIVHTLTTSSCILAIRNFMARRGIPQEIFSDNATNFIGAERELKEAIADVDKNSMVREFTTTTTKWSFIPPNAPHMGGAWERLIRSVKNSLYRALPTRLPNEELLKSMMAEVENIVNSRPLCYIPLDSETANALTPNHILVGRSNGMKPLALYDDSAEAIMRSWHFTQHFADRFWSRWVREFLPSLTCRTKWHEKVRPIKIGDLVIVVDPSLPRNVWPRGKVIDVKLAPDLQVRSAKVQTKASVLERPACKLAVLDVAPNRE